MNGVSLGDLVARFGGEILGNPDVIVSRIATLDAALPGDLAFLSNPKYRAQLATTKASAVIVAPSIDDCPVSVIVTKNPYLYFARVSQWMNPMPPVEGCIHPSAVVEGVVDASAHVSAHSYIGPGATIGAGASVGPNCSVLAGARVGPGTRLRAGVTIYENCIVGENCLIHAGAVIGSDGFGFARDADGSWVKIPQVGRVVIGDNVEIGACTSIDRGALSDTVIADGVKLDNQIQIAHNVTIGEHTAIAGCVGIAGSTTIGQRCTVGGAAMVIGHLTVGDDVNVASGTHIAKSIASPGLYSGAVPFMAHGQWLKNFSHIRHLEAMSEKLREMEKRLSAMEKVNE